MIHINTLLSTIITNQGGKKLKIDEKKSTKQGNKI